jgi:hypothetical protein
MIDPLLGRAEQSTPEARRGQGNRVKRIVTNR